MFKLYKAELISNNLENFLIYILAIFFKLLMHLNWLVYFIFTNYRKQLYYKHTNCIM